MARAGGCATGTPGDGIAGGREPGRAGPTGAADIRGHGVLSVVDTWSGTPLLGSCEVARMTTAGTAARKGGTRI